MNLQTYTELANPINQRINKYSEILNSFDKNASGMVEITPEFKLAKDSFEIAFNELRALNKFTPKSILRELSRANRAAKIAKNIK